MSSHSLVTRTVRLTAIGALLIVVALALSTTLSADGANPSPQPSELSVAWQFNGFSSGQQLSEQAQLALHLIPREFRASA